MVKDITKEFKEYSGLNIDASLISERNKMDKYTFYLMTVVHNDTRFDLTSGVLKMEDMYPMMVKMINEQEEIQWKKSEND